MAAEYWLIPLLSTLGVGDKALAPEAVSIDLSSTEDLCISHILPGAHRTEPLHFSIKPPDSSLQSPLSLSFPSCFFSIRHADSHNSIQSVASLDSMSRFRLGFLVASGRLVGGNWFCVAG